MLSAQIAHTDADVLKCWPVMYVLRPHLVEGEFLPLVRRMMEGGYQLAFLERDGLAVAAIGYRYLHKLHDGLQIYIDDLTTLPEHRGQGYGAQLLHFVHGLAVAAGCQCITLDSGPTRHDAHRLYLNQGYRITSMHFTYILPPA